MIDVSSRDTRLLRARIANRAALALMAATFAFFLVELVRGPLGVSLIWSLAVPVFVGGVVLGVRLLVSYERRAEREYTTRTNKEVLTALSKLNEVTDLFSLVDRVSALEADVAELTDGTRTVDLRGTGALGTSGVADVQAPQGSEELAVLSTTEPIDIQAKVARAWRDFVDSLADALPALRTGARLDLTLHGARSIAEDSSEGGGRRTPAPYLGYAVSVAAYDDGRLTALAVGNASLAEPYRLNRAAIAHMVALGWSPPEEGTGSKYFELVTTTGEAESLATILARTMREVYRAPHPAFLDSHAIAARRLPGVRGPGAAAGSVGLADDVTVPLPKRVRVVTAAIQRTTPEQLLVDADGDIGIRTGSAMAFVRVRESPPMVDVLSPVLTEVQPSERLYRRLSELTNRMPVGRLYYAAGTVWASVQVLGNNFQPSHLVLAVRLTAGLVDELEPWLVELGGRRFVELGPAHYPTPPIGPYVDHHDVERPVMISQEAGQEGFGKRVGAGVTLGTEVTESVAVEAYLDTNERAVAQQVIDALDEVALLLGYEGPVEEQWFNGSIWRRARAVLKGGLTSDEVRSRLIKIERALELAYLDARQAEVDARTAEAVTQLIASLNGVPQACLRVGSILVVKYYDDGAPVLLTRNLSQLEIHALERFPEIQTKPPGVLGALATAVENLPPTGQTGEQT